MIVSGPNGEPMVVPDSMGSMFGVGGAGGNPYQQLTAFAPPTGLLGDIATNPQLPQSAPPQPAPTPSPLGVPSPMGPNAPYTNPYPGMPTPGPNLPPLPPIRHIGPGTGDQQETRAGSVGQVPGMGGDLPNAVTGQPAPVPQLGDLNEIPVQLPSDATLKQRSAANQKAAAAAQKQAGAVAAYQATPQGQMEQGEAAQLGANRQEQALAGQAGDLQAKEAQDVANLKTAGEKTAELARQAAATRDAYNAQQVTKHIQATDDAIKAEANYKVDENRRWNSMSTGRKVLAGISVALSGLGDAFQGKGGQPNMALSIITGAIKDDVEAQLREREHLGKRIGIQQTSLDNYRKIASSDAEAGQLKIAEEYKRTAAQIDVAAAQYGSPKAKLAAQQTIAGLNDAAGKIITQYGEAAYNRSVKQQELANQKASIGVQYGHLALANKQFGLDEKKFTYQQKHDANEDEIKLAAIDAKAKAKDGQIGGVPTGIDQKTGQPTFGALTTRDGQPLVIAEKDAHKEVSNVVAGAMGVNRLSNQLAREIDDWGGQSDLVKSPHWQQIKSDYEALVFALHRAEGIEGFRPGTAEMLEKLTGDVDPTSFVRNAKAGIIRARDNVNAQTGDIIRARTGQDVNWDPIDTTAFKPPTPTVSEQEFNSVLGGKSGLTGQGDRTDSATRIRVVQTLAGLAQSNDPRVAADNLALLQQAAKSAPDTKTRDEAQSYLTAIQNRPQPMAPNTSAYALPKPEGFHLPPRPGLRIETDVAGNEHYVPQGQ